VEPGSLAELDVVTSHSYLWRVLWKHHVFQAVGFVSENDFVVVLLLKQVKDFKRDVGGNRKEDCDAAEKHYNIADLVDYGGDELNHPKYKSKLVHVEQVRMVVHKLHDVQTCRVFGVDIGVQSNCHEKLGQEELECLVVRRHEIVYFTLNLKPKSINHERLNQHDHHSCEDKLRLLLHGQLILPPV
jgi:hypothetical protein